MRILALIILILSGLTACNPDKITVQFDKDGIITRLPHVWKSSISDGVLTYGLYHGYILPNKGVLSLGMRKSADPKKPEYYLQLKDLQTGQNIWTWNDFYNNKLERPLHSSIVVYDSKLIIHDLWSDYCIDWQTGKTIWKRERGFGSASELTSIDNSYFVSGLSQTSKAAKKVDDSMFIGTFDSEEIEELVKPPYSSEFTYNNGETTYIGSIYRFNTFERDGEQMLLLPYDELGEAAKYNNARSFFGLYNLSKQTWVYNRKPLNLEEDGATPSLMPLVSGEKAFMTSLNSVGCFDVSTGKRIWQYRMTDEHTGFQDMILVDNKLVISAHNGTLYCIDTENGARNWALEGGAFSSDIYHQDGILYGVKGDVLAAYELNTGKTLWNLESLDSKLENRDDSEFDGFVTGIPASNGNKGRIFATTNLNLYCFEAAR